MPFGTMQIERVIVARPQLSIPQESAETRTRFCACCLVNAPWFVARTKGHDQRRLRFAGCRRCLGLRYGRGGLWFRLSCEVLDVFHPAAFLAAFCCLLLPRPALLNWGARLQTSAAAVFAVVGLQSRAGGWQWLTPPRPWQRPGAGKSGAGGGIWWFPNSGDTPQTPHHWHGRVKRLRA